MKPMLTTVRALRELATGMAPDAISSSAVLFEFSTRDFDVLVSAEDDLDVQRVTIWRETDSDKFVPNHLTHHRRDVLSRMASFGERARIRGPLSLPRAWHQYKHKNYIAFFAVPNSDGQATRWIVEVLPGDRSDVVFWQTTTSENRETLQEFDRIRPTLPHSLEEGWQAAVNAAGDHFARARKTQPPDTEVYLSALAQSATKGWTYEQWLGAISEDQRAFIEAPTTRSVRLRGPAGSGKTLALALKAVREVLRAREMGEDIRVLIATHSWALAAQIDDSMKSMGVGDLPEIDIFPLLEIAKAVSPHYVGDSSGFTLVGEDSYSGKRAQLDEIIELLADFVSGDWITYAPGVSLALRSRFESQGEEDRLALAWDLLIEFGSVIGAAAIFPGAGSEQRYFQMQRASWMLPLTSRADQRVVFRLYERYMASLDQRTLITSDQVLADFLSHLETHAWNRARRTEGYDLVFVDEFHLFSPLERQVLHYLTRDVVSYPRIFMALDPRQSPSEAFIGIAADETRSSSTSSMDERFGDVDNFELTTVHRFSPQILNLIKHVHHEFPTFDLGGDWDIDFAAVDSARVDGPLPRLVTSASRAAEETDIAKAVHELYPRSRLAIAVVDTRQWGRFSALASRIGSSAKYHVSTISGRSDIEGLGYRSRGLVVGPAEYLAGLQFDTVLVAGISDLRSVARSSSEKTRLLSLLYLALSRARQEVRVFVNDDDGGAAEVLLRAAKNELMVQEQGSLV